MDLVTAVKCKVYTNTLLASNMIFTDVNTSPANLMGSIELIVFVLVQNSSSNHSQINGNPCLQ